MDLVTEFHYQDGDVGAYADIDVRVLWSQFTTQGHVPSHILIRPDTDVGQRLSNSLHGLLLNKTNEPDVQSGDLATSIDFESSTLRGHRDIVTVLRLSPAATTLVADALSALNPDTDVARQFAQELASRLNDRS